MRKKGVTTMHLMATNRLKNQNKRTKAMKNRRKQVLQQNKLKIASQKMMGRNRMKEETTIRGSGRMKSTRSSWKGCLSSARTGTRSKDT